MELLKIKLLVDKKVVQETLNRIGITSNKDRVLYPSCYIYEDEHGDYYLCHFKELFLLLRANAYNNMTEEDTIRRNSIANKLMEWGMIDVSEEDMGDYEDYVYILPYNRKHEYKVAHKINLYTLRKFNFNV